MNKEKIDFFKRKSKDLRRFSLEKAVERGEGHLGGAFSIIEILVAIFGDFPKYKGVLEKEDIFILSKGHAALPYFRLLQDRGYQPNFTGHPEIDVANGIPCTTGSLGHGLPIGTGMAMAKKLREEKGNIYVLMSDGECQEGTTWESMLQARQRNLDNLKVIIDYNGLQTLGKIDDILSLKGLANVFSSIGWEAKEVCGHHFYDLDFALRTNSDKPSAIIAYTTKGKGVSFMENNSGYHTLIPNGENLEKARRELS